MSNREFSFATVDVFTSRPLEGNQLAIFPDARGLTDEEMQLVAKEMNLSETTFIFPRDKPTEQREGIKVRIFTVNEELPFAGHPTLGTAWYIRHTTAPEQPQLEEVTLDLKVGKVPVRFKTGSQFGEMRQVDPHFGEVLSHAEVAEGMGLKLSDMDETLPIQTVSTGVPFTIVAFRSLSILKNLNIGWAQIQACMQKLGTSAFFYFVCRETVHAATLHARMIFYNGEDPATGSAAGCCTAWAVKYGVLAPEEQGLIEQGLEARRPSFLHIRGAKQGEVVTNIRVGGEVVHMSDGMIRL